MAGVISVKKNPQFEIYGFEILSNSMEDDLEDAIDVAPV